MNTVKKFFICSSFVSVLVFLVACGNAKNQNSANPGSNTESTSTSANSGVDNTSSQNASSENGSDSEIPSTLETTSDSGTMNNTSEGGEISDMFDDTGDVIEEVTSDLNDTTDDSIPQSDRPRPSAR